MHKRFVILSIVSIFTCALTAAPAYAQYGQQSPAQNFSIGGGFYSFADDPGGGFADSGYYVSVLMKSTTYMLEFDWSLDGVEYYALSADYLYPLSSMGTGAGIGTTAYIGIGYTYFASDDLGNESGLNAILAADLGSQLFGSVRYDFLENEVFSVGASYSF